MPTPAEHRALLFVAAVAALGIGVRGVRAIRQPPVPVADRSALARQIAAVDSLVTSGGRKRTVATPSASRTGTPPATILATPTSGSALVDLDRASLDELDRLPGIGPTLAARIVADRESRGPFGSLDGLQRVKGVGPALAKRVQPYVTFSLPPRPSDAEQSVRQGVRRP